MQQSKAYELRLPVLFFALFLGVVFSSCAPAPSFSAPKQSKRCIAFVGATWCSPCNAVKRDVFPQLEANGLKIARYQDKTNADIHTLDADEDARTIASWKLDSPLPASVVFEGQSIVEIRYGRLAESDFYRLLGRDDLLNKDPPAELTTNDDDRSTNDNHVEAVPVADSQKSPWDQLVEILGCDTAVLTLTVTNGRRIVIEEAGALVHIPETLTARVKVVNDAIQIDFDKPQVQAEGKKFGIRLATNIPSVTLHRDNVRVSTGLGIPFVWKLENHPFGDSVSNPDYDKDD